MQPIRYLIFDASLRERSLNHRLASLAGSFVEQREGVVDRARLEEFDCPTYDQWVEFLGEKPDPFIDRVETASLGAS